MQVEESPHAFGKRGRSMEERCCRTLWAALQWSGDAAVQFTKVTVGASVMGLVRALDGDTCAMTCPSYALSQGDSARPCTDGEWGGVPLECWSPPPILIDTPLMVEERAKKNVVLGAVKVNQSSADALDELHFSILAANDGNLGAFKIGLCDGVVRVSGAVTLNYVEKPSYQLIVNAARAENAEVSANATVTIDLIDLNDPPTLLTRLSRCLRTHRSPRSTPISNSRTTKATRS